MGLIKLIINGDRQDNLEAHATFGCDFCPTLLSVWFNGSETVWV